MFKEPFNFDGRIRRTEYGISLIAVFISMLIVQCLSASNRTLEVLNLLLIPIFWLAVAQGVKRCHDINRPGWYQIIPFYVFVLIFNPGDKGENEYGLDPKEKISEPTVEMKTCC
jgi:uncharacterized membrane protein YhaH (DUF805 family)